MFDQEYFEKNEFVKKIYSFENLQCIEDQNDVMHICFNIDINFSDLQESQLHLY